MQILIHLVLESNIQDLALYSNAYRRYSFSSYHSISTAFDPTTVIAVVVHSAPKDSGPEEAELIPWLCRVSSIECTLEGLVWCCGPCSHVWGGVESTEEQGWGAGSHVKGGWKWPLFLLNIKILKTATGSIWDCGLSCAGHFNVCNCPHFTRLF